MYIRFMYVWNASIFIRVLSTNLSLTAPYSCNLLQPRWHFITTIARPEGHHEGCMDIVMHSSASSIILRNLHRLRTNYPRVSAQWFHFCFYKIKVRNHVHMFSLGNKISYIHRYDLHFMFFYNAKWRDEWVVPLVMYVFRLLHSHFKETHFCIISSLDYYIIIFLNLIILSKKLTHFIQ